MVVGGLGRCRVAASRCQHSRLPTRPASSQPAAVPAVPTRLVRVSGHLSSQLPLSVHSRLQRRLHGGVLEPHLHRRPRLQRRRAAITISRGRGVGHAQHADALVLAQLAAQAGGVALHAAAVVATAATGGSGLVQLDPVTHCDAVGAGDLRRVGVCTLGYASTQMTICSSNAASTHNPCASARQAPSQARQAAPRLRAHPHGVLSAAGLSHHISQLVLSLVGVLALAHDAAGGRQAGRQKK